MSGGLLNNIRQHIRHNVHTDEGTVLSALLNRFPVDESLRTQMHLRAVDLVKQIRDNSDPTMMELFLGEYGLSTDEGVALMCLAEALLRVPDGETIDELIDDKITPSEWGSHLGQSHSSLINASTWALFVTGKVLDEQRDSALTGVLAAAVKRLGEPIIRQAVTRVMKELGDQFVLGQSISSALKRAQDLEKAGFTYSYDMLGEAARCETDAKRYHIDYAEAITALAAASKTDDIRDNPGISIKLSALHPRYEMLQKDRVINELMPRARSLAVLAKSANIGLNIDAEEADRLDLSLDIIEAILADPMLKGWDGFGIVVQAYSKRASYVIDYLYELAERLDRKIMVRLVKGAYWDSEVKHAQTEGLNDFPVFTRKASTDVSYICCAKQLLAMTDRIYPQFATHSAHSAAAIVELSEDKKLFEFQRLHGMGESLHATLKERHGTRCRIYAPVGRHKDLLAYLVRRLLENGANSSFVSQIVDENVPPEEVAADPFATVHSYLDSARNPSIPKPCDIYQPQRTNSAGLDLSDPLQLDDLKVKLDDWKFGAEVGNGERMGPLDAVVNPATCQQIGTVQSCSKEDVGQALKALKPWAKNVSVRAEVLRATADLYESHTVEFFALLINEAGKTLADCVSELREAVDFLRYYAAEAERLDAAGIARECLGIVACISPWNFPLAIFTGQISAALAAGNAVAAKPAETTSLIAQLAVSLLHKAGVPAESLCLLPGSGSVVGAALTSDARVSGICFTGSTATAQTINKSMAENLDPGAPLVAETGGLNAMIVDSTALPEQVVRDVLASAFQSAGQRCSALRVLYLQEDVADSVLSLLMQAMDELRVADPADFTTDIGPVIDSSAEAKINEYLRIAAVEGRLLKSLAVPEIGYFVSPSVVRVESIADVKEEVFGPVLHVATFAAEQLESVFKDINNTGYGLTFGMHSRIDDRVQFAIESVTAGNIYINRNQIGAVVGSQPFGGLGLSGTGPKAGGPNYLPRFTRAAQGTASLDDHSIDSLLVSADQIDKAFAELPLVHAKDSNDIHTQVLPGPTGESNRLSLRPRDFILCLGPGAETAQEQLKKAQASGCRALAVAPGIGTKGIDGVLEPGALTCIQQLGAVVCWSEAEARSFRVELAERDGPIIPLLTQSELAERLLIEHHVCIDTTAAGGNAALLANSA